MLKYNIAYTKIKMDFTGIDLANREKYMTVIYCHVAKYTVKQLTLTIVSHARTAHTRAPDDIMLAADTRTRSLRSDNLS